MQKTIILAWNKWIDIDAYACMIALSEIYKILKKEVFIFLPKETSASVTETTKRLKFESNLVNEITEEDKLILVDVSNKNYLEKICKYNLDNVIKIYDHHFESTKFWKEKIWENAIIENIWACASLIIELAKKEKVYDKIWYNSKLLLFTAIISHTFNLKYKKILTKKDLDSYNLLFKDLNIKDDFIRNYFNEVSKSVFLDPYNSLKNDHKIIPINNQSLSICQLELWEQDEFINKNIEYIIKIINLWDSDYRFYMWIDINKAVTYFISDDDKTKKFLQKLFWRNFNWNILILKEIIIRKELIKKLKI